MGKALELPVTLEEVLLHVAHHTLGLALGARALRPACLGRKPIVVGQLQETGIKNHAVVSVVLQNCRFLVIDEYRPWCAAKVAEGLHQGLVGVFGILAGGRPGMETPRITQRVDCETDLATLAGDHRLDFAPVVLELEAGRGLEAYRLLARSQRSLGLDVHPHDSDTAGIALLTDQLEDHLGVPDVVSQQLVDDRLVGIQLAGSRSHRSPTGSLIAGQVAPHGAFTTANLVCNVHEVGASLMKLPYHEKVLSA